MGLMSVAHDIALLLFLCWDQRHRSLYACTRPMRINQPLGLGLQRSSLAGQYPFWQPAPLRRHYSAIGVPLQCHFPQNPHVKTTLCFARTWECQKCQKCHYLLIALFLAKCHFSKWHLSGTTLSTRKVPPLFVWLSVRSCKYAILENGTFHSTQNHDISGMALSHTLPQNIPWKPLSENHYIQSRLETHDPAARRQKVPVRLPWRCQPLSEKSAIFRCSASNVQPRNMKLPASGPSRERRNHPPVSQDDPSPDGFS